MTQTNILLESGTNELEIVEFYIDEVDPDSGEVYQGFYGVNVAKVLEIIRKPSVTNIPSIPHPSVLGAFNLRSRVMPLIDLGLWLGKKMAPTNSPKVIVSEFNRVINAFLVSGVNRIHRLSWEQVEAPDPNLSKYSSQSITGVVRFENRILLLLDMEQIIADLNPGMTMRLVKEVAPEPEPEAEPVVYKALVVDDSNSIRRMIASLLEKAGLSVTQTINGKEAWDRLMEWKVQCQAENRPMTDFLHILISDIEMPVMDGHNLTKRVKDDPVLRQTPVVLFSSLITERLRHKGESVGADDQVSKPDITTLAEKAFSLIHKYHGHGPEQAVKPAA